MVTRDFSTEILRKIQSTEADVKKMVAPLLERGWLSRIEEKTIFLEAQASKEAILKALQTPGYDQNIQSELIYRLLERYQEAIFKVTQEAINRQYTDDRIKGSIDGIHDQYDFDVKEMADKGLIDTRDERELDRLFQREQKKLFEAIRKLPSNHPKRGELIEQWVNEFRKTLSSSLNGFNPKLDTLETKTFAQEDDVVEGEYRDIKNNDSSMSEHKKEKSFWSKLFGK